MRIILLRLTKWLRKFIPKTDVTHISKGATYRPIINE